VIQFQFKPRYRVVHLTQELGNIAYGGIHTHCSEQYRHRSADTGFALHSIDTRFDYEAQPDVVFLGNTDIGKLEWLDFDILVIHHWDLHKFLTPQLLATKRLVYACHGIEPLPSASPHQAQVTYETLLRHAIVVVCESAAEAARLSHHYPEYASKVTFIHNGISMPESIEIMPPRAERRRLGHIGRLVDRKGLLQTLKAMRDLDAELHIAADVDNRSYVQHVNNYLDGHQLGRRVFFHGFCVGARRTAFFAYVDAVVVSSLWEPFGYTTIEPVLHGTPVIVANNSGPGEIVGPDYRYRFNPFLIADQARVLREFLDDPSEQIVDEFGKLVGRLPMFDATVMVKKYQKLFNALGSRA